MTALVAGIDLYLSDGMGLGYGVWGMWILDEECTITIYLSNQTVFLFVKALHSRQNTVQSRGSRICHESDITGTVSRR